MASVSAEASAKLEEILGTMMATQPANLGYPSETSQSSYYPSKGKITEGEIKAITKMMEARKIAPENTRLRKRTHSNASVPDNFDVFEVPQASVEKDTVPQLLGDIEIGVHRRARVFLCRGDHSEEMGKIRAELTEASTLQLTKKKLRFPSLSRASAPGITRLSAPPTRRGSRTKLPVSNIAWGSSLAIATPMA
jgi:dipeptidyl-peptidase-3